jgi:hypothetical protein
MIRRASREGRFLHSTTTNIATRIDDSPEMEIPIIATQSYSLVVKAVFAAPISSPSLFPYSDPLSLRRKALASVLPENFALREE